MCSTWATPPHKKLWPKLHTSPTPPPAAAFFKPCPSTQLTTARPTSSRRRKHLANTTKLTSLVEENSPLTNEAPNPQGTSDKPFEWTKWWYAAVLLEDLEPKRPTPVKILGRDLVLWRDVDKQWRCFEDACPHRLAPLSEGRIEPSDGSLMCSYHGWRFQSDGTCTRIPQAKDGGASTGCKNPRSKAQAYPVMISKSIVWIWPDDSPTAFIDSSMAKPNGPDDENLTRGVYMRDLPYPIDGLIENILDVSHVPFSHHGIEGDRDKVPTLSVRSLNPGPDPLTLHFVIETGRSSDPMSTPGKQDLKFCAPDLINQFFPAPSNATLSVHGTPTSSTTCRVFTYATPATKPKSIVDRVLRTVRDQTGFNHLYAHRVLDGDTVFINRQMRNLRAAEESGKSWKSEYFMPYASDIAIVEFRRWLNGKIGGGGPRLPNGDLLLSNDFDAISDEALLNRFDAHTKHCKRCQRTLSVVRSLKTITTFLSWGCIVLSARFITTGLKSSKVGLLMTLGGALLFAVIRQKLGFFESVFYYREYKHWKIA